MEHAVLNRIRREGFVTFGWFEPEALDGLAVSTKMVLLIGNAGPSMFERFSCDRGEQNCSMDEWTKSVVDRLATDLDAKAVYPFDKPALPFLTWARRAKAGHVSPLGLNIHQLYGLWHAYRAALLFPVVFDFPRQGLGQSPCDSCVDKPCLAACPVKAFDGASYDVVGCGKHIKSSAGTDCMTGGCKARLACPVGPQYVYAAKQISFHMNAFRKARAFDNV